MKFLLFHCLHCDWLMALFVPGFYFDAMEITPAAVGVHRFDCHDNRVRPFVCLTDWLASQLFECLPVCYFGPFYQLYLFCSLFSDYRSLSPAPSHLSDCLCSPLPLHICLSVSRFNMKQLACKTYIYIAKAQR